MNLVSRDQWGARPPKSRTAMTLPQTDVWLHHTAGTEPDGPDGVRAVQRFHMDTRGYADIAYSFVVDRKGVIYEGRGAGVQGAHTKGHNSTSHAICVLGHYDRDPVPAPVVDALVALLRHGARVGWWPAAQLTGGHRDVGSTSCPGNNLYRLVDDVNRMAKERTVATKRIAGADRHATAAMLAYTGWPTEQNQGGVVFLVRTESADTDAVANLASRGPILTVERDALPKATAKALGRYRPVEVVAVGGVAAISDRVLEQARQAASS